MKDSRQLGLFTWIRQGVHRAVVLGFSDAMTQIGSRAEHEEWDADLAEGLRRGLNSEVDGKPATAMGTGEPSRKRLGRSLEQIRESNPKTA